MTESAKYRIQAVAEMTGIPAATLRAWERRYGVPTPARTESSYRLYSSNDVDLIRKLRELCDAGMAPAEAARVVHRIAEAERTIESTTDPFEGAQQLLLSAVEDFDPTALELGVRRMMFLGSAPVVFERVLAPVMRTIGTRWHAGEISVGQEHMASEILCGAARDMLRLFQADELAPMVVLACFADEEHVLPLYGVAFRFTQWGYRTCLLGARTPATAIRHAVAALDPVLVGLSTTVTPPGYRARELVDEYAQAIGERPWIVGGSGAAALSEHVERAGGVLITSDDLNDLRPMLDGLVAKHRRRGDRNDAAALSANDD